MGKYNKLALEIIEGVGGKGNVINVTHCMTRLRFDLKDLSKINENKLKDNPSVISTARAGGKFQVIIGNSVGDVYQDVVAELGLSRKAVKVEENVGIITKFTNTITKIITPTLGVLVSAGLMKGLIAILVAMKLITPDSGTYAILNALGDSLFYFFPIILGYTSAETFGLNKFLGMVLGATLIYPTINEAMLAGDVIFEMFANTPFAINAKASFLGIPVIFPATGYASTVIPIILITLVASKVEAFFKKLIPDIVGFAFVPFLTLLISVPFAFIFIGPIANLLQSLISWGTVTLYEFSPILTAIVVALVYQPLVIFGLHWPLITLALTNFTTLGFDYLWPMMFTASFAQTAVVLAVGVKTKNKKTKAMAVPATISGMMCIIEPAIYGFSLPDKKRFAISCFGAAVGGVIITLLNAHQYVLGTGLFGFAGFVNPNGDTRNMIIAVIATLITMVITFALTYITYKETEDEKTISVESSDIVAPITSPVKGEVIKLNDLEDQTFASEVLGTTYAVRPTEGKVIAPFSGVVLSMFPTGHALGIVSNQGVELLVHVGMDTVNLDGKHFTKKVEQGQTFEKGDVLLEFDIDKITAEGYNLDTTITLTNSNDYQNIVKEEQGSVNFTDTIIKVG